MSLKHILVGSLATAALAAPVFADQTDYSFAVHDIIVTSNIPAVNISVRNMSASTDPADRDLRMVSDDPAFHVTGQVWCKSFNQGQTAAERARIVFGNANVVSSQNGADLLPIGPWGMSQFQTFSGSHNLENFSIQTTLDLPSTWNGGVNLGPFNPVEYVEGRLDHYVEQGAGSEADFLRVDDVFETTITLNAVGWCSYQSQSTSGEYAGLRAIEVPVHIFYHGDADIQDVITSVGGANTMTAPVPNRARGTATARGANSQPPATSEPPARARPQRVRTPASDGDGRPQAGYTGGVRVATGDVNNDGAGGALILPAVQAARASGDAASSDQGTITYTGLENRYAGIEPDEIDNRFEQETAYAEDCPTVGSVVRREATNAIAGALFGSRANDRNRDRRSTRERLADDAIDRMTQC